MGLNKLGGIVKNHECLRRTNRKSKGKKFIYPDYILKTPSIENNYKKKEESLSEYLKDTDSHFMKDLKDHIFITLIIISLVIVSVMYMKQHAILFINFL